jgi:hypothetical protein
MAAKAKEEQGRLGGPPPGFKPKGGRATPAAEEAVRAAPAGRRRQTSEPSAAPPARATRVPPGFGEYSPNDPRYQGLTDAEQVGVRVEQLDPPRTGPVTGDVVRRRGTEPAGALSAFHADVLPAEEERGTGVPAEGVGDGPANVPLSEEMGGAALPDWETEKQRRQQYARDRGHEGELDNNFVNNEKPHIPLSHEGEGVPWKPPAPLPQKACSMSTTSSQRSPRAAGRGGSSTMRTTPRADTSCPSVRGGAMAHELTLGSRSSTAFCSIWDGNGFRPMRTSLKETTGDGGFPRTKEPIGWRRCSTLCRIWQLITPPCPTSLTCGSAGHSMSAWYCRPVNGAPATRSVSSPQCTPTPTGRSPRLDRGGALKTKTLGPGNLIWPGRMGVTIVLG